MVLLVEACLALKVLKRRDLVKVEASPWSQDSSYSHLKCWTWTFSIFSFFSNLCVLFVITKVSKGFFCWVLGEVAQHNVFQALLKDHVWIIHIEINKLIQTTKSTCEFNVYLSELSWRKYINFTWHQPQISNCPTWQLCWWMHINLTETYISIQAPATCGDLPLHI